MLNSCWRNGRWLECSRQAPSDPDLPSARRRRVGYNSELSEHRRELRPRQRRRYTRRVLPVASMREPVPGLCNFLGRPDVSRIEAPKLVDGESTVQAVVPVVSRTVRLGHPCGRGCNKSCAPSSFRTTPRSTRSRSAACSQRTHRLLACEPELFVRLAARLASSLRRTSSSLSVTS